MKNSGIAVAIGLLVALSGCTASEQSEKIDKALEDVAATMQEARERGKVAASNIVKVEGKIMAVKTVRNPHGENFPASDLILINNPASMTFADVAASLERQLGLSVQVNELDPLTDGSSALQGQTEPETIELEPYYGPVEPFVNRIANHFGFDWYHGGDNTLQFFREIVDIYTVDGPMGRNEATANLSTASTGGANGGSDNSFGSQNDFQVTNTVDGDFYKDLEEQISKIIPVEKFDLSAVSSTLLVRGTRAQHLYVQRLLDKVNANQERSITLNVTIASVQVDETDSSGFQLDGFLNGISGGRFDFRASSPVLPSQGGGPALTAAVLEGLPQLEGTQFILDALQTVAKINDKKSQQLEVLNLDTSVVQLTTTRDYVKSRKANLSGSVNNGLGLSEINSQPLQTGFALHVQPRIKNRDQARVRFKLSIKSEPELTPFGEEGNQVQLAKYDNRSFLHSLNIRSGQTIVASAVESNTVQHSSNEGILGSNKNTRDLRNYVIVIVEGYIKDPYNTGSGLVLGQR